MQACLEDLSTAGANIDDWKWKARNLRESFPSSFWRNTYGSIFLKIQKQLGKFILEILLLYIFFLKKPLIRIINLLRIFKVSL